MASCRRSASRATSLRLRPVRLARRASWRFRSGSKRIVRAELFMSDNVIQAAPPNKRLKQLKRDPLGRPARPIGGCMFVRRAVIGSQRLPTEVGHTLRRLSAIGESHGVNDLLRGEGVDSLHFALTPDGECRITSEGLARIGYRQPRLAVDARPSEVIRRAERRQRGEAAYTQFLQALGF